MEIKFKFDFEDSFPKEKIKNQFFKRFETHRDRASIREVIYISEKGIRHSNKTEQA